LNRNRLSETPKFAVSANHLRADLPFISPPANYAHSPRPRRRLEPRLK
jgi:hypothetical protein